MKRRSKEETRAKIIDAAYGLFWRRGFLRVSSDEIAARAGITKRTLYQHFPSKDDIITAALAHSSELALARFQSFRRGTQARELIESFFGQLGEWAGTPRWSGGGFTRVVVELADQRGHPARAIARKHKAMVERWLQEALADVHVAQPGQRARDIMLLMEGAMALMLIHGDRQYANAAARAALQLIRLREPA